MSAFITLLFWVCIIFVYLGMGLVVVCLFKSSSTWELRWKAILGLFGGILAAVIFMIIEDSTKGLPDLDVNPAVAALVGFVLGLVVFMLIHLFILD